MSSQVDFSRFSSFFMNCSSRKLIRIFWIAIVTLSLGFSTYFFFTYTNTQRLTRNKAPSVYLSNLENWQHPFFDTDSLIKDNLLTNSIEYIHVNDPSFKSVNYGHGYNEIENLLADNKSAKPGGSSADITVLLHYSSLADDIQTQVRSVLSQSVEPKFIFILCHSEQHRKLLQRKILRNFADLINNKIHIKVMPSALDNRVSTQHRILLVKDALWLFYPENLNTFVPTKFTWVLEPGVMVDPEYLHYTYGLLGTDVYKSSIIGYDASLLPATTVVDPRTSAHCLSSTSVKQSHSVDMVHGSWLLRTSWTQILKEETQHYDAIRDLPLAYFISSSLFYRAGIQSVIVPTQSYLLESSRKNLVCQQGYLANRRYPLVSIYPNVMDLEYMHQMQAKSNQSLVFILSGSEQAIALVPLMCKLINTAPYNVHIILSNGLTRPIFQKTLDQIGCDNHRSAVVHDLTSAYNNGVLSRQGVNGGRRIGDTTASEQSNYLASMSNLFAFIRPDVSIQVKEEHPRFSQSVESIAQEYNATSISLPLNDIKHALWISDLSIAALKHWNDIKMDLVVITDRRPRSLARLLESANNATYLGDKVELVVNMEQTADHKTHNLVNRFQFTHGLKKVRHRIRKGGLMPAIVESWYPSDNDNYGVLLEDDIELSPLFYVWSKYNILKYRYEENNDSDAYRYVYGVSLYSPRNLELLPEGRRPFNPEPVLEEGGYSKRAPYATQIPCSWGAVYFPEHWREFHAYLTERIDKEEHFGKGFYNITVPESRSERWKKSWKKYFIELVYLRAYVMVYPNFEHFQSFSTNHLEYGTHVKESKQGRAQSKLEQFLVPLMQNDDILAQLPDARLPRFDELPKMDLWGRLRTLDALDQVGAQWHQEVSTCQREQIGAFDPSDLLCPFETNVLKSKKKRSQY